MGFTDTTVRILVSIIACLCQSIKINSNKHECTYACMCVCMLDLRVLLRLIWGLLPRAHFINSWLMKPRHVAPGHDYYCCVSSMHGMLHWLMQWAPNCSRWCQKFRDCVVQWRQCLHQCLPLYAAWYQFCSFHGMLSCLSSGHSVCLKIGF